MKMIRDRTGRFVERPFYEPRELDIECENLITDFLRRRHSRVDWPITTDDLTTLIEELTNDLDLYADLSDLGPQVEGVTDFLPGVRPRVRISSALSGLPSQENRLRTTLTHEIGHVHLHTFLFNVREMHGDLFENTAHQRPTAAKGTAKTTTGGDTSQQCRRETILNAKEVDWMEWQAGYACGAILMPISPLRQLVEGFVREGGIVLGVQDSTEPVAKIIAAVAGRFSVSREAAKIRLMKTRLIVDATSSPSVFE